MAEARDWKCPNKDCRALLGVLHGKRDLNLTSGAAAPDRGIGYWVVACRRCGHRRRWFGRIHG